MKYKRYIPLSTFLLFVLMYSITSQYYPDNSWGGALILFCVVLPIALLVSVFIVMINSKRIQLIALIIFYLLFIYFFVSNFPTLEEIRIFGIRFN